MKKLTAIAILFICLLSFYTSKAQTPIVRYIFNYTTSFQDIPLNYDFVLVKNDNTTLKLPVTSVVGRTITILNASAQDILLTMPIRVDKNHTVIRISPYFQEMRYDSVSNSITVMWNGTEWVLVSR